MNFDQWIANASGTANHIGKGILTLFAAAFVVYFIIGVWQYTHAPDDMDLKRARKRLLNLGIGALLTTLGSVVWMTMTGI